MSGWEHHWEDEWEHGGEHRGWSGSAAGQLVPPSGENIDTFEDSFAAGDVERLEMDLNYAILQITAGPEDGDIQLKGRNARSYFRSALEGVLRSRSGHIAPPLGQGNPYVQGERRTRSWRHGTVKGRHIDSRLLNRKRSAASSMGNSIPISGCIPIKE